MILGLSHIAFSSADIEAATKRLAAFGYAQRFDAPTLENHIAKTPFLTRYQPRHHIRALAAPGAMAIELLDHGGLAGPQSSALIPVFRSAAPCADWQPRKLHDLPVSQDGLAAMRDAFGVEPEAFHDPALSMTLLWIPTQDEVSGLYACATPCDSPEAMAELLGQLRFRPDSAGVWSLLTPMPALQARLVPVTAKPARGWIAEPVLDAPGCVCLALMARDTERVLPSAFLQRETVSFTLSVNGKNSRITLARPNHGPFIELVDQPT